MTSTDLALPDATALTSPDLESKIRYAKMLAAASLLPQAFRQQPANVLYAVSYGEMLGLPPMAAITGIHVIEGRPSISAGLISALVRRAGHKLRVIGDENQAQAELVRADDPGFTYKSVWTLNRARQADLLGKTNWKRYPAAMLKARAISEVARDACQEVLLGMQYTADELGDLYDDGGEIIHDGFDTLPNGAIDQAKLSEDTKNAIGLMSRGQRVEHESLRRDGEPPAGAVQKLDGTPGDDPWQQPESPPAAGNPALGKLTALFGQLQLDDAEQDTVLSWLAPGEWTASATQIRNVTSHLKTFLADAGGDVAEARTQMWERYRAVQDSG
jgi:hypothetical protein